MENSITFLTKVSKDGTIQLPESLHLENQEVEIRISKQIPQKKNALDFVRKWKGILKGSEGDYKKARQEYLEKKHQ
ncbi:hypothetical protein [Algoriphagus sp. AK58]|jgi:hypothetical protein|uniref:hypothetical protein n=1 Tax=Algoriphagus sp. AK58 TaxID=1406877 RepID=UPI001650927B|nr:hypothetical protein [Algoriphagus sp. AK58]MBC6366795.1 hypothetical protein [Algoriphagus sp. AK58]